MSDEHPWDSSDVEELTRDQIAEPDMFRVVLHNDDYTSMEFVVEVLISVFHQTMEDATRIMLDVHERGRGVVGTYTFDIATTKAETVEQLARKREYPLRCTIEPA